MGLLDSALGMMGGQNPMANPQSRLVQAALSLLSDNSQSGGLSGLMQRFQQAGLGDIVNSWIGTGENQPISGQQVQQALGGGPLEQVSNESGMSQEEAAQGLSGILPDLIDRLTPDGQMPAGGLGDVGSLMGQFLGKR